MELRPDEAHVERAAVDRYLERARRQQLSSAIQHMRDELTMPAPSVQVPL